MFHFKILYKYNLIKVKIKKLTLNKIKNSSTNLAISFVTLQIYNLTFKMKIETIFPLPPKKPMFSLFVFK